MGGIGGKKGKGKALRGGGEGKSGRITVTSAVLKIIHGEVAVRRGGQGEKRKKKGGE